MSKNMKFTLRAVFSQLLAVALLAMPATAGSIGMVADDTTKSVTVFDADADVVLGSIALPDSHNATGDCSITADGTLGFVTDFAGRVYVIDLTTSPPSLAAGTNPIPISNPGEDTSLSPDQKFLVVCDGGGAHPISVIDIAARAEVNTFFLGTDCNSVEVCSDGSVLVTSVGSGDVRRLVIDGDGNLKDTGDLLFSGGNGITNGPNNVFCTPDAQAGIVVRRGPSEIRSFTIPGLALSDIRSLTGGGNGISGVFDSSGTRAYVRSNGGAVDVFAFTPATGQIGPAPLFSIAIGSTGTFYGMDQMALHPGDGKLYVSQAGALNVYDASDGTLVTSITDPAIDEPTGVCVVGSPAIAVPLDIKPGSCPNSFNRHSNGNLPVALVGTDTFDVTSVDVASLVIARADGVGGGVPPTSSPPIVLEDVTAPFAGEPCECDESVPDGIMDLSMKFNSDDLVEALELDLVGCQHVELEVSGTLLDGTAFAGLDCVRLVPTGDLDADCVVGVADLLVLLATWGPCPAPPGSCEADFNESGDVGVADFLVLLANWG
jgi:hypothetical protein